MMTALESAWTIPSRWYTDPTHYALEQERVLLKAWHYACHTDHVKERGSYFSVDVCGEPVVIVRGDDDVIRAFSNVCRHRAGRVVVGAGCERALQCTYHGWTYALDGALKAAPEMQEACEFDHAKFALRTLRCTVWHGYVLVSLAEPPEPFFDVGAEGERVMSVVDPLRFSLRRSWDIKCNWKVYVDNFLEGYHVPRAHPGLFAVLDYKKYVVEPAGNVIVQRAPGRAEPLPTAKRAKPKKAAPSLTGDGGSVYFWLFPCFMVNINPDYVQTNAIVPVGADTTRVVFDYFFPAKTSAAVVKRNVEFSDHTQDEDIALCEGVQRNLSSMFYTAGRYCPRRENGVHHFHELVRHAVV